MSVPVATARYRRRVRFGSREMEKRTNYAIAYGARSKSTSLFQTMLIPIEARCQACFTILMPHGAVVECDACLNTGRELIPLTEIIGEE